MGCDVSLMIPTSDRHQWDEYTRFVLSDSSPNVSLFPCQSHLKHTLDIPISDKLSAASSGNLSKKRPPHAVDAGAAAKAAKPMVIPSFDVLGLHVKFANEW